MYWENPQTHWRSDRLRRSHFQRRPPLRRLTIKLKAQPSHRSDHVIAATMEEGTYDEGASDYNRPRRPNTDTISYLRSLPLDIQASSDEISKFLLNKDEEFPQSLSAAMSAIDEVRNEVASLAGDEYGSQCIEILTRIAAPYSEIAARTLLLGLAGYHVHLATHRYGSHVVQTVLQLAVSPAIEKDLGKHDDSPQISGQEELPSLSDLILGVVQELSPFASQLAVHVCGSHVLRTLLCVLGGVELIPSPGKKQSNEHSIFTESGALRRGKPKSKKKKKKKPDGTDHATQHAGMMHMVYLSKSRVDKSFQKEFARALESLTEALSGCQTEGPGELQQMACHSSAGPLLIVLLRVLTYSSHPPENTETKQQDDESRAIADFRLGILKPEPTFELNSPAHRLAERILCLQPTAAAANQKYAGDVIFGLSGEPRGSHVLETLLRTSLNEVYGCILECGDFANPTTLQDYVVHDVSNFVIQTVLNTLRTKEQAEAMLKSLDRSMSSGYVLDPTNKRRAVLWRATELAAKYRVGQDALLKAVRLGFAALAEKSNAGDESSRDKPSEEGEEEGKKKKKRRRKASTMPVQECVKKLLDIKPPENGRVVIDVAGARTIYNLLNFPPRLCGDVLDGIVVSLSEDELEWIIKDGLGSRCIMDGILENSNKNDEVFVKAVTDIVKKLNGRWVGLAVDRVGHHTVKKVFWALSDMDDRAVMAVELAQSMNRLSGNAMGRTVIDECCLKEFNQGEKAWKDAVNKKLEREAWLAELGDNSKEKHTGKKKRKRKRHKSGGTNEAELDDGGEASGAAKQQKHSVVESIMNVMSVK